MSSSRQVRLEACKTESVNVKHSNAIGTIFRYANDLPQQGPCNNTSLSVLEQPMLPTPIHAHLPYFERGRGVHEMPELDRTNKSWQSQREMDYPEERIKCSRSNRGLWSRRTGGGLDVSVADLAVFASDITAAIVNLVLAIRCWSPILARVRLDFNNRLFGRMP